jgi:hypothetical protein
MSAALREHLDRTWFTRARARGRVAFEVDGTPESRESTRRLVARD